MRQLQFAILAAITWFATTSHPALGAEAKPIGQASKENAAYERAIAPHVARARSSYPEARGRFVAGLPDGQLFFLTTQIKDGAGRVEQVFILVETISQGVVTGKIANDIQFAEGYRKGQRYSFSEADLMDWLILHQDGSEEGNFVGKFLDTYTGE